MARLRGSDRLGRLHMRGKSTTLEILATGAWTPLLIPISWVIRRWVPLDDAEIVASLVALHVAHFVNDPHFAATYLLFYADVPRRLTGCHVPMAQRLRYMLAGFVAPAVLVAWAAAALATGSAPLFGWMIQLMYLAVGWHYARQGFGVLVVLAARRGTHFDRLERTALLVQVVAAWAFAWASPPLPEGRFVERGVVYWAPARPEWATIATGVVLAISSVVLVVVLVGKRVREGRLPWLPLGAFVTTLWLWGIGSAFDPLVRYFIPALHGVQYLFFVALLRGNEARADEGPPRFAPPARTRLMALAVGAVVLGWVLFRGAPRALDDAFSRDVGGGDLGPTPFVAAFYVVVNLHHFAMDAVIWRREHPPMRHLLGA